MAYMPLQQERDSLTPLVEVNGISVALLSYQNEPTSLWKAPPPMRSRYPSSPASTARDRRRYCQSPSGGR